MIAGVGARVRPVLVPERRQALRALSPALWLGSALCVVGVAALVWAPGSDGGYAALFAAVVAVVVFSCRALVWLLVPGSARMDADDEQLWVRRWGRTTAYPWASVTSVSFDSAAPRVQWSAAESLEVTVLRRAGARSVRVVVLAIGRPSLANARRLSAECARHGITVQRT